MKRGPTFWRRVALSATILSAFLLVTWIGSNWVCFQCGAADGLTVVIAGGVVLLDADGGLQGFMPLGFARNHMGWEWALFSVSIEGKTALLVPIWSLLVPCLAVAGISWSLRNRSLRAARIGHCQFCNYNRAGIDSAAPCPECNYFLVVAH